jgi:nicotinamide-nucleotide amidase
MSDNKHNPKRVAFLATGDEIVNGDILNTNGQAMAQALFNHGIHIGTHMVVSDEQEEIIAAIQFLLHSHDALIITGGLGPTSDDRTRFALSSAVNEELVFNDTAWENIEARFKQFNLKNQPESNKQQALFPESSTIIPNQNGTAAGCWINFQDKFIFMLPGPPPECMPMFHDLVFPALIKEHFATQIIHKKWLLFGVSEGEIADTLDKLAAPFDITTGYRVRYPYVEFKAHSENEESMNAFIEKASPVLEKNLINNECKTASEKLLEFLNEYSGNIQIQDDATGYLLEKILITQETYTKLNFQPNGAQPESTFVIEGIPDVDQNTPTTWLSIQYNGNKKIFDKIPWRGKRTLLFSAELICKEILQELKADF